MDFGLNGLFSGIAGVVGTKMTNDTNKDIADNNLGFQKDNLDYIKALNQQLMQREDTSYVRTVQDMRNAGLSPPDHHGLIPKCDFFHSKHHQIIQNRFIDGFIIHQKAPFGQWESAYFTPCCLGRLYLKL